MWQFVGPEYKSGEPVSDEQVIYNVMSGSYSAAAHLLLREVSQGTVGAANGGEAVSLLQTQYGIAPLNQLKQVSLP